MKEYYLVEDLKDYASRLLDRATASGCKDTYLKSHGLSVRRVGAIVHGWPIRGREQKMVSGDTADRILMALDIPWVIHGFSVFNLRGEELE